MQVLLSVMLALQWGAGAGPVQFAPQQPARFEIVTPDGAAAVEQYYNGAWLPVATRFDWPLPDGEYVVKLRCNGEEKTINFRAGESVRVEFTRRNFGVDMDKVARERYTLSGQEISRGEVARQIGQLPDYRNKTRCVVVGDESKRRAFVAAARSVAPDLIYHDYAPDHWAARSGGYRVAESGFAVYLIDDKGRGSWRQDSDSLEEFRQGVSSVRKPPDPAPNLPGPKSPVLPNIDLSNLPPWVPVALVIVIVVLLTRGKQNA